jgi:phosphatidylserine decarboxylase
MTDPGSPTSLLVPIHPAGWPFIAIFFAVAVVFGFVWKPLLVAGLLLTVWCVYFFRDPPRVTPTRASLVVSPCDGVVAETKLRVPPPEMELGDRPLPCVGVFMNVFDVHVNRTPVPGRLLKVAYHKGQFLNASLDKASDLNERQSFKIEAAGGGQVGIVQIAGLVARRIIGFVEAGRELLPGERIGLIRFGSRCDVYLPQGVVPSVLPGQRMVAGETVIADLVGPQTPLEGRVD